MSCLFITIHSLTCLIPLWFCLYNPVNSAHWCVVMAKIQNISLLTVVEEETACLVTLSISHCHCPFELYGWKHDWKWSVVVCRFYLWRLYIDFCPHGRVARQHGMPSSASSSLEVRVRTVSFFSTNVPQLPYSCSGYRDDKRLESTILFLTYRTPWDCMNHRYIGFFTICP